jgi:uncharacterized protein (TIGR02001 family)
MGPATKAFASAAVLASALLAASSARGEDLLGNTKIPGSFSANVWGVSEYFFRGLSQTDDKPAIQGGVDYTVDLLKAKGIGGYLGLWGSNVDFNEAGTSNGASIETDWYGGLRGTLLSTGINWDTGFIYYWYPGADGALHENYYEGKLALSYDWGFATTIASYNYSPDFFAASGDAHYPKFEADVPIGTSFTLSVYIARQFVADNARFALPDYTEYNARLATKLAGFDMFVAYTATSIDHVDAAGDMVYGGIGRSF